MNANSRLKHEENCFQVISINYKTSDHIPSSNQDRDWTAEWLGDWVKLGKAMPDIYPQIWYGWLTWSCATQHTRTQTHASTQAVCLCSTHTDTHLSKTHAHTETYTHLVWSDRRPPWLSETQTHKPQAFSHCRLRKYSCKVWFGRMDNVWAQI